MTSGLQISESEVVVMLKGFTYDGQLFIGTDSVVVVQSE